MKHIMIKGFCAAVQKMFCKHFYGGMRSDYRRVYNNSKLVLCYSDLTES